jgi:lysophospholipase L1-like esterase
VSTTGAFAAWCVAGAALAGCGGAESTPQPLTLATFGTSLTERGQWQAPLKNSLEQCRGAAVTVLNFGAGGKDSTWGWANVMSVVNAHPDAALIEFSMNDAWQVDLDTSKGLTLSIIRRLQADGIEPILMTMNPDVEPDPASRGMDDLPDYYQLYRDIAAQEGVRLIDNAAKWGTLTHEELVAIIPDGVHPTPEAVQAVAVPEMSRAFCRG